MRKPGRRCCCAVASQLRGQSRPAGVTPPPPPRRRRPRGSPTSARCRCCRPYRPCSRRRRPAPKLRSSAGAAAPSPAWQAQVGGAGETMQTEVGMQTTAGESAEVTGRPPARPPWLGEAATRAHAAPLRPGGAWSLEPPTQDRRGSLVRCGAGRAPRSVEYDSNLGATDAGACQECHVGGEREGDATTTASIAAERLRNLQRFPT